MAALAVVMLSGCSGRSAAQKAYLVDQSGSLGKCTVNPGGGGGPRPFDPMRTATWNRMNDRVGAWARVTSWRITSKPKDPPQDRSVDVAARFDVVRGNRSAVRPAVQAFQQDAKSISRALGDGLDVFVAVQPLRSGPYVTRALAFDTRGRIAWLGECASGASNSMATRFEQAGVHPKRVGPAVRRWLSDGDAAALLRELNGK
jgi:hypothetical protein